MIKLTLDDGRGPVWINPDYIEQFCRLAQNCTTVWIGGRLIDVTEPLEEIAELICIELWRRAQA